MPNDEVCLNCKILEQNTRKVPLWQKMEGNDSLLPLIIRLDKYNPKKSTLIEEFPTLTNLSTKILMESNKRNKWVFYWAATKSKNPSHIMSEKDAYGSNTNHGILKTDDDGNAEFVLNCPQPYKKNNKITYPRHVHYTFLTDEDIWNENINSLVVLCHLDFKQMREISDTKSHMIIRAYIDDIDTEEEYEKIPNSVEIDIKILSEMNRTERKHYLLRFLKKYLSKYPKLEVLVDTKKLKLRDIPIVTYCKNKSCKASFKLSEYLIDANMVNVIEYSSGLEDWSANLNKKDENNDIENNDIENNDIENNDDDMEKVEYDGKEYYIHKDTNDVSSLDDYKIVGKWDPERKMILWYNKTVDGDIKVKNDAKVEVKDNKVKDNKVKENEDVNKGEINVEDKYKQKIIVNKLEGDGEKIDKDDDDSGEEMDHVKDLNLEESDDIIDNLDDKHLDELFEDPEKKGGSKEEDSDTDTETEEIDTIKKTNTEINNYINNVKNNKNIKIDDISTLNRKYRNKGIRFF